MILEVTVLDASGHALPGVELTIVNNSTGLTSSRVTDGDGYSNHAVQGKAGQLCTFTTNGYAFTGSTAPSAGSPAYYTLTAADDQRITLNAAPFKKPFRTAPRFWKGNMCGIRIQGLPFVVGMEGAPPGLFLSWFYDRYLPTEREFIRGVMRAHGYTHWLLSWPDSRVFGQSPQQFLATCKELIADGFYPCVMLSSKDCDPPDVPAILVGLADVLPSLVGVVPMFCIGWELSLWLSPTQVQQLIDAICPAVLAMEGTMTYVHFQQGYGSFQQPGKFFADFWNPNVGKLTGLLHQKIAEQTKEQYRSDSGGLQDILIRFAGGAGCSPESGFGHPFDCVALEITAMQQFGGTCSEAQGDALGQWAIDTPPQSGPAGSVGVMGSGNGL